MTNNSRAGFFITGSDTGVGKTWLGCQLVRQLITRVQSLKVRKPVESGCEEIQPDQLYPADGDSLFRANGRRESLDIVTPYRFRAGLAPDRAALLEDTTLTLSQLVDAVFINTGDTDTLVVEGAGGFYSPIAANTLNADLAIALGLQVIIVIPDRLGAINQALLTINAVQQAGLKIFAVLLNQTSDDGPGDMDNRTDLCARVDLAIYQCHYQGQLDNIDFREANLA